MNSIARLFLLASVVAFVGAASATCAIADAEIGNGFTCNGTAIKKGTKTVTYKKAKSTLQKTISKLKEKLALAKKKKNKDALKAQIATAKSSKVLLLACSSGDLSPDEVDPIFTQLTSGTGVYNGEYSGVAAGVIPLSGTIEAVFQLEGTNFGLTLTFGGNLANTLDSEPLAFQTDVGGIGFPAQVVLSNTFLGTVTLTISQDGRLSITNSDSEKGTVAFEGDFSGTTISSSLSGTYENVPFEGTATLERQQP